MSPHPVPPPALARVVGSLRAAGCVFAEEEAALLLGAARSGDELAAMVDRRVGGMPLEQVLGWADFCGLRVVVEPGVFVPRRRTGLLVATALALLPGAGQGAGPAAGDPGAHEPVAGGPGAAGHRAVGAPVVVDLCCGSGAVGAAMLAAVPGLELHAADVDPAAVRCARRNLDHAGGQVHGGDLFDALPADLAGRVDVLVANAPYVPTDAIALMPPEARTHEHAVALDGGGDGLDVLRRVAAGAPAWLAPRGHLVVESSRRQAGALTAVLRRAGFHARTLHDDDLDATAVVGRLPDRAP